VLKCDTIVGMNEPKKYWIYHTFFFHFHFFLTISYPSAGLCFGVP